MRLRLAALAGLLALATVFSMPAFAQYVGGTPPSAGPTANPGGGGSSHLSHGGSHNESAPAVRVSGGSFRPQSTDGLAVTGADILQLALLAGVCCVGGVIVVRSTRRRPTVAEAS